MQMNSLAISTLLATALAVPGTLYAQSPIERTELHRADLTGVEGIEVIVAHRVVQPGATVPLHTHPGDEHLQILQGGTGVSHDGT
jgi:quercetin dioxygenase-like cupin family protein